MRNYIGSTLVFWRRCRWLVDLIYLTPTSNMSGNNRRKSYWEAYTLERRNRLALCDYLLSNTHAVATAFTSSTCHLESSLYFVARRRWKRNKVLWGHICQYKMCVHTLFVSILASNRSEKLQLGYAIKFILYLLFFKSEFPQRSHMWMAICTCLRD